MDRQARRDKLIEFLKTIQRPDAAIETIDDDEGLIAAGLIDSLALLEIIAFLESEFDVDFSETGVDPGDVASIRMILDRIERHASGR